MSVPFLLTVLGIGLMISTRAKSQAEGFQLSRGTVLPSVFLSGYTGFPELWPNAAILTLMGITTTLIAARLFVQQEA